MSATTILGVEATLTGTASNVDSANFVRIHNTGTGIALITIKSGSTTVGSFTMVQGEVLNLQKGSTETIEKTSGAGIPKVVKVGFGVIYN
jgi:hypothetical protein